MHSYLLFLNMFFNFYVLPYFMTGHEYKILGGLSNTVSLFVVTFIDYCIENIYFIETYLNSKRVILKINKHIKRKRIRMFFVLGPAPRLGLCMVLKCVNVCLFVPSLKFHYFYTSVICIYVFL